MNSECTTKLLQYRLQYRLSTVYAWCGESISRHGTGRSGRGTQRGPPAQCAAAPVPNVACVKQAAGMRPSKVHYDEEPDDDDDDEEDDRRDRDLGDFAFIFLAACLGAKAGAPGSSVAVVSRVPVELGVGTKGAAPTESTRAFGWPTFAISASD